MSSQKLARGPILTLEQAFQGNIAGAMVFTEHLRRWLEVRPNLQLTLSSKRLPSDGALASVVAVSWNYADAPEGLEGTRMVVQEVELVAWPLWTALGTAARELEAKEREIAAEVAKKAQGTK